MKRGSAVFAGAGALAFAVLTFAAFLISSTPGGSYSPRDVSDFVAKGHRPAVFISLYLVLFGVLGLISLLARLRQLMGGESHARAVFWASGLVAAATFAAGWAVASVVPIAMAYGGRGVVVAPPVVYVVVEAGWILLVGAGGVFLALSLIVFALGSRAAVPAWFRWVTLGAGVIGLASAAWFPFFVLLIWALVAGVWMLVADRPALQPAPSAASA
jgi:hypothetical protein